MLYIPKDYLEGIGWMERLNSSNPQIKAEAEESPPKSFSGNTDRFYSCPDLRDDRFFFSAKRGAPIESITNLSNVYNDRVPLNLKLDTSRFIRDSSIALFPRGVLIPYNIKDPNLFNRLLAMLPSSSSQFVLNETNLKYKMPYGRGFQSENTTSTMSICYKSHIPFKRANSCIEGGNCFLFMSKREKKAVVGEHSVILSMIALEEQGLLQEVNSSDVDEPSLEAVRMARNLHLYEVKQEKDRIKYIQAEKKKEEQAKKEKEEKKEEEKISNSFAFIIDGYIPYKKQPLAEEEVSYRKSLLASLSEEEKKEYFEAGKLIEAKLKATKQMIVQELGVKLKDAAFIPQTEFHIDMELLALPDGKIVLHDDGMVEKFLEPVRQKIKQGEQSLGLLDEYVKTAERKMKKNKAILERSIKILQEHDIDCERMPMVFKASKFVSQLNYSNGIFLNKGRHVIIEFPNERCFGTMKEKGSFFVTTGPTIQSEKLIHDHFVKLFNSTYPNYTFVGIDNMSEFVQKYKGGIHCLSMNVSPIQE